MSATDLAHRPVHNYRIPRNDDGGVIEIEIRVPRELRTDNLNLATWSSSQILASQLHQISIDTSKTVGDRLPVLEIGAGTGLVGLSAAALWSTNVVLTDLEPILPGLAMNIEANQQTLEASRVRVACGSLDWNAPQSLTLYSLDGEGRPRTFASNTDKATVILAADTVYDERHPILLSTTIFSWLKPGQESRAIISYPLRVAYLDHIRELWQRLEDGGLHCVSEGRAETGIEWDDEPSHEWSVWTWNAH